MSYFLIQARKHYKYKVFTSKIEESIENGIYCVLNQTFFSTKGYS